MKKIVLLLIALLFALNASAQERVISGQVISAEEPDGMPGVSVVAKGTNSGVVTDIFGKYTLSVPEGVNTLVFTFVGFQKKELEIGNQSTINVTLNADVSQLDEVVVIGYGVQKKKVATGAISQIGEEAIEGYQVANVQTALSGQITGVVVSEASGQPGAGAQLFIRGVSTNGDNSPLYVIDGLQVDNINNINPNDIESVDVLKDAASSAIYGARAANGVVIITTKKGSNSDKGKITYEGFMSVSNPWRVPEMLSSSQYIDITREKFGNANQLSALAARNFPQSADGQPNTDWMNQIFEPAPLMSHRLSATGRNSFLSLEYWDQDGVIGAEKSNYKRYSARFNSTKNINDYLTVGENIVINRVENQNIGVNNAFGTVIVDAFAYDPITAVNDPTADYGFAQSQWVQKEYINPESRLFIQQADGHSDQITGNIYAEITPVPGLRFRTDAGVDYLWFDFRSATPTYNFHPAFQNPLNDVSQGYGNFQTLQWENYVNYDKQIDEHSFDIVLGTTYRTRQSSEAGGSSAGIPLSQQLDPNWQYVSAGIDSLDLSYGSQGVPERLISYYGRLLYNYKETYLFSATVRRDGSSKFGRNNRWGIFPSFSAGWVISNENFFDFDAINYLKVRGSWGVNGNDRIGSLAFASRVVDAFSYGFGRDQLLLRGAALATPPNPNVKWEESDQINFGLEVGALNDKLLAEFDVYQKTTRDLLMQETIPGYIGATNPPISNLGEIRNRGLELGVTYRSSVGKVNFSTRLNYTTFTNEVLEVAGEGGFINGWNWPVRNTPITRMTEGQPVGHFVGYKTDGIFQSREEVFSHINSSGDLLQENAAPGDLRFVDVNGDGTIDSNDITSIGDPWADHIFGLTLNADFMGFDISAVFAAQLGHDIYRTYERSDVAFSNYQTFWLDRWTPDNPSTEFPRLIASDPNNNQRPSDFYVQDGSFLRLRNFQLGYTIPSTLFTYRPITYLP